MPYSILDLFIYSILGLSERTSGTTSSTPASSSGWLQPYEGIVSQVEFVTSQVKSADFDHFHQAWPWLHVPTFAPDKQTTLLTSALTNLSMWMQNADRHHLVPYAINQELTRELMPKIVRTSYIMKRPSECR